jgi:hypothetical protein
VIAPASDLPLVQFVVVDEPDNAVPALATLLIDLARREQDAEREGEVDA